MTLDEWEQGRVELLYLLLNESPLPPILHHHRPDAVRKQHLDKVVAELDRKFPHEAEIRCTMCDSTITGVKEAAYHLNGHA